MSSFDAANLQAQLLSLFAAGTESAQQDGAGFRPVQAAQPDTGRESSSPGLQGSDSADLSFDGMAPIVDVVNLSDSEQDDGQEATDPRRQALRELLKGSVWSLGVPYESLVARFADAASGVAGVAPKRRAIAFKMSGQRRRSPARKPELSPLMLLRRYTREGRCCTLLAGRVVFELDGVAYPGATPVLRFRGRRLSLVTLWLLAALRARYEASLDLCDQHGAERLDAEDRELLLGFLQGAPLDAEPCEHGSPERLRAPVFARGGHALRGASLQGRKQRLLKEQAAKEQLELLQAERSAAEREVRECEAALRALDAEAVAAQQRHKRARKRYASFGAPSEPW